MVRVLYPGNGVGLKEPKVLLPRSTTDARQGTEDKVDVMEERARRGEPLFHPNDGPKGD